MRRIDVTALWCLLLTLAAVAQERPLPIIDMHLHARDAPEPLEDVLVRHPRLRVDVMHYASGAGLWLSPDRARRRVA